MSIRFPKMNANRIPYSDLPLNCPGCGRRFSQDDRWVSVMRRVVLGVLIGLPAAVIWGLLFTWISGVVFLPGGVMGAILAIGLYGWPLFLVQWIGRRMFWPSARLTCGKCPYDESFLIDPETIPEMYDKK